MLSENNTSYLYTRKVIMFREGDEQEMGASAAVQQAAHCKRAEGEKSPQHELCSNNFLHTATSALVSMLMGAVMVFRY
jgi:hypothetical protein